MNLENPLASSSQLETSASQLDGLTKSLEDSVRYETFRLVQTAGTLLSVPQEIIASAIVLVQRYLVGPEGGSLLEFDARDVAAAALYLSAKPSAFTLSARSVCIVFGVLKEENITHLTAIPKNWRFSNGDYELAKARMFKIESEVLRTIGFQTQVALPYCVSINYLQTLEVFQRTPTTGSRLAKRVFALLNSALLSPQLLYLTHQPTAIAAAAIYLAARQTGVKLPEVEWWEVFDVDREQLGFLVVAMLSLEGFAGNEKASWDDTKVPLTVKELHCEMERQRTDG
ncbi:hypothetical protein K470DRAFT_209839 [Piedraia hortae CBS 480.64]|uniref:Uncharacterized protein n=1 Tax=Piedraia hortae CBS 480.64 TaxID=1314780 RepID=A0A6A7C9L3_9PEZI|nr:hypothetical protein K470DRAFT_209839 [Piedraia hortae CBS 480.64]